MCGCFQLTRDGLGGRVLLVELGGVVLLVELGWICGFFFSGVDVEWYSNIARTRGALPPLHDYMSCDLDFFIR